MASDLNCERCGRKTPDVQPRQYSRPAAIDAAQPASSSSGKRCSPTGLTGEAAYISPHTAPALQVVDSGAASTLPSAPLCSHQRSMA